LTTCAFNEIRAPTPANCLISLVEHLRICANSKVMKKIIFNHFSALVVQIHVHINMYIQITPAEPDKKATALVTIPSGGCSLSAIPRQSGAQ
jgi:hypothetical protein